MSVRQGIGVDEDFVPRSLAEIQADIVPKKDWWTDDIAWTDNWPTVPGTYWFYGDMYGELNRFDYHICKVWAISNGIAYVTEGTFMHKAEGALGIFAPITFPGLPGGKLPTSIKDAIARVGAGKFKKEQPR